MTRYLIALINRIEARREHRAFRRYRLRALNAEATHR